jgi:hypothetical protein
MSSNIAGFSRYAKHPVVTAIFGKYHQEETQVLEFLTRRVRPVTVDLTIWCFPFYAAFERYPLSVCDSIRLTVSHWLKT